MKDTKVLIVLYYWPPAGGPGVQRWLKFVKYLSDFGIEAVVYCPKNANYPIIDQSLLNDIPKGITILKHPIKEPYRFSKFFSKKSTKTISKGIIPKPERQSLIERLLLYIRGNFFIPDARKSWIKPSVKFLLNYINDNSIKTIITTGPPHSMHLIGLQLKKQLKINWITDFRDPWTTIGYHKALKLTKSSQHLHKTMELEVLNTADHIVVTSPYTKNEFETKTKQPISVITNGYDLHADRVEEKDEKFTLSHIGSLLSERNPEILWEVLSELTCENKAFSKAFQLNLIGVVSADVLKSISNYGLEKFLNTIGYVAHNAAIAYQQKSRVLLLIEINSEDTRAIIPGKVFEYMISKTPILAIGPKDSDVEQILLSTHTGSYFTYEQKEALKAQIVSYFNAYKQNTLRVDAVALEPYSRKALTRKLSNIIKAFENSNAL